jgi:hypothetical protein
MKRKIIIISMTFATAAVCGLYVVNKNDRFLTMEIQSDHPYEPLYEPRPLTAHETQEVGQALSQPFRYFGCGGQAFVFFSDDGKYALKFFKQRHFRQPTYLSYIPFIEKYRNKKFAKRKKRIVQEYSSYKIGFEELPHETELVYLHLNNTHHFKRPITLVDRLGLEHHVDLAVGDGQRASGALLVGQTSEKWSVWGQFLITTTYVPHGSVAPVATRSAQRYGRAEIAMEGSVAPQSCLD